MSSYMSPRLSWGEKHISLLDLSNTCSGSSSSSSGGSGSGGSGSSRGVSIMYDIIVLVYV